MIVDDADVVKGLLKDFGIGGADDVVDDMFHDLLMCRMCLDRGRRCSWGCVRHHREVGRRTE